MMMEHSKKYAFRFGKTKIVFSKNGNETEFHVYARAFVYGLYYKRYPTLRVEAKVDERFSPDLSAVDYDGTMIFWAECGNVSINKIEKLFKKFRQAHFVFVREQKDVELFERQLTRMSKDMRSLPLVDVVIYPEHFHDWWVSEEGDVFIPKEDVIIRNWHDPQLRKKYF